MHVVERVRVCSGNTSVTDMLRTQYVADVCSSLLSCRRYVTETNWLWICAPLHVVERVRICG